MPRKQSNSNGNGNGSEYSKINSKTCHSRITLKALNEKQKDVLKSIKDNKVTIIYGAPGSGKTFLSVIQGLKDFLENKKYRKIIFTRPCVEAFGEKIGFLPGDFNDKIHPYMMPIFNILEDHLDVNFLNKLIKDRNILTIPIAYLRGMNFDYTYVVADEMQNSIPEQMHLLLTRLGKKSKIIITGDINQTDIDRKEKNGLKDAIIRLDGVKDIGIIDMGKELIVRDPLIIEIEKKYNEQEN